MSARRVLLAGRAALPAPAALAAVIARRRLRKRIEAAVSRLIEALDALDPDPEAEPWLGTPELPTSCRAIMFLPGAGWAHSMPLEWARGANDDRETEDEHGGDVLDEPHDAEPDEDDSSTEPDDRDLPKSEAEADAWYPS